MRISSNVSHYFDIHIVVNITSNNVHWNLIFPWTSTHLPYEFTTQHVELWIVTMLSLSVHKNVTWTRFYFNHTIFSRLTLYSFYVTTYILSFSSCFLYIFSIFFQCTLSPLFFFILRHLFFLRRQSPSFFASYPIKSIFSETISFLISYFTG